MAALSEKEQFLRLVEDALGSAVAAELSYAAAVEAYVDACFLWELAEAAAYASAFEEWARQTTAQLQEAKGHWEQYQKEIARICEPPKALEL